MVFSTELQETLAGLEEDLDIPSFAVNSDDFIFIDRHVRANESDPVFAVGTISYATILASIWAPSLAGSPTFTGTDRRYLERPRRFLHALKICLTFIRFPSNSYVILELFFTMAITFKPR